MDLILPILALLALFAGATAFGVGPVTVLFQRIEARRELKEGSGSRLRIMQGWWRIGLWVVLPIFIAAFIGDWATMGDPYGAFLQSFSILFFLTDLLGLTGP